MIIDRCYLFKSTFDRVSKILANEHELSEIVKYLYNDTKYDGLFTGFQSDVDYNEEAVARGLTITSQILQSEHDVSTDEFTSVAKKCIRKDLMEKPEIKIHTKYRSIDGRGNNKNHPEWGSTGTPFARFGSKNVMFLL